MVQERARAKDLGIPSPVYDTFEETEENFHNVIDDSLDHLSVDADAEVMIASHNRHSVKRVIDTMHKLGIPPSGGVHFGQLLGMADHVTMPLGQFGYKAYKYVPYGPVDKVMPYLIRRTQENSTFLGSPGVQEERSLVLCRSADAQSM